MSEGNIDVGYKCSCCGQFVKRYTRRFNGNMCTALICLYRYANGKFVHLEKFLAKHGYKRCGDASYLIHYGLLEKQVGDRKDGSKRNGHYKITGRGIMFVEGSLMVQEKFLIYNNECQGFEGKEISIKDAIGKAFDYNELMGITSAPTPNEIPVKAHLRRKNKEEDNSKPNYLF